MRPLALALLLALAAPAAFAQSDPSKADQAHVLMGQGNAQAAMMMMREHVAEHPGDGAARMPPAGVIALSARKRALNSRRRESTAASRCCVHGTRRQARCQCASGKSVAAGRPTTRRSHCIIPMPAI